MFGTVLELTSAGFNFHIGTIVRGECGELSSSIESHVSNRRLTVLPGRAITATQFAHLLNLYELGLGETECIAHAQQRVLTICTDDKAARQAAERHLGTQRVVGSLALIRECVRSGRIASHAAFVSYELMRAKGAFLPDVPPKLCTDLA
jgi:predicted nucleic acid-binding protein